MLQLDTLINTLVYYHVTLFYLSLLWLAFIIAYFRFFVYEGVVTLFYIFFVWYCIVDPIVKWEFDMFYVALVSVTLYYMLRIMFKQSLFLVNLYTSLVVLSQTAFFVYIYFSYYIKDKIFSLRVTYFHKCYFCKPFINNKFSIYFSFS